MSDNIWRTDCLNLGHQGENGARELKVYVTDWQAEYPSATIRLQILRPGEDVPYYAEGVTVDGGVLTWIPSSADTGFGGYGKAELQAVQGETIVKSAVVKTFTEPCLPGTAGEVPPSMKPWTDAIEEAISDIDGKLDAPETAGTAGQVLKLNSYLEPVWGTGGGGGSDVTVTPIVSTGTKIAEIDVDGTTSDLYAPNELPSGGTAGDVLAVGSDGLEWSDALSGKADTTDIPVSVVTPASGSTFTLDPCPVTYSFGEKAELAVTVTALSQFHFMFSCPSSAATVLTINGETMRCGDTLAAGKTYEVDIWAGITRVCEVDGTAVTP